MPETKVNSFSVREGEALVGLTRPGGTQRGQLTLDQQQKDAAVRAKLRDAAVRAKLNSDLHGKLKKLGPTNGIPSPSIDPDLLQTRDPDFPLTGGTDSTEEPSFLIEEGLPILGGTAGAMTGLAAGGPVGAIIGGALGAGAGELSKQVARKSGVFPGNAPETLTSAAGQVFKQAAFGGSAELGGQLVGKGLQSAGRKLLGVFEKSVTPEGKEALEYLADLNRRMRSSDPSFSPLVVSPAKVTDSRVLDVAANAADASIITGAESMKMARRIEDAIDDDLKRFIEGLLDPGRKQAVVKLIREAAENRLDLHRAFRESAYKRVDVLNKANVELVPVQTGVRKSTFVDEFGKFTDEPQFETREVLTEGGVDITEVKKYLLEQSTSSPIGGGNPAATAELKKQNANIQELDDMILFSGAEKIKTLLSDLGFATNLPITSSEQAVFKIAAKKVSDALDAAAEKASPQAKRAYDRAKEYSRLGRERFNDKTVKAMLNPGKGNVANGLEPKDILETIVKPGSPETIKLARNTLRRNPVIWEKVQGEFFADLMQRATKDGVLDGKLMLRELQKFDKGGSLVSSPLSELFPKFKIGSPERLKTFRDIARIKDIVIRKQPDATGRLAIQFGQISSLVTLGTGALPGTTQIVYLLGPSAVSRIFKSPRVMSWLGGGGVLAKKSKFISRSSRAAQFATLLTAEGIDFDLKTTKELDAETDRRLLPRFDTLPKVTPVQPTK